MVAKKTKPTKSKKRAKPKKRIKQAKPKGINIRVECDDMFPEPHKSKIKTWSKTWCGYDIVKPGISFGSALAIVLSYFRNESILWAIVHGILSWLYVIYVGLIKIGWIAGF